MKKELSLVC